MNLCITTGVNCTQPGAEVTVIGNFVTSIKGLEAFPVPVESLRLRLRRYVCSLMLHETHAAVSLLLVE